MSLVDRLAGIGDPENNDKMAVFAFHAMLQEMISSEKTQADIIAYFSLDAGEQVELQWIIDSYTAQPDAATKAKFVDLMRTIFILSEAQVSGYTVNADIVARINRI